MPAFDRFDLILIVMLQSVWQAGQALWGLHKQAACTPVQCTQMLLTLEHGPLEADRYEPRGDYQGTVIAVHGMSPKGKSDPRMVSLCSALSKVGLRVIAPEITSIKALTIDAAQIDVLAEVFLMVAEDNELCPSGRLGVLAPSFSGAMCLAAAALPRVHDKIETICAIGAFTQVETVMSYLLQANDADPYGRFIALKKIISFVYSDDLLFQGALDAAIEDNLNERVLENSNSALAMYLHNLNSQDREAVIRLFYDADYRKNLFLASKPLMSKELAALDIVQRVDHLSAKVFLLHGRSDCVIPCAQSEHLYHHLKRLKKNVSLVITPFISHGDTQFHFSQLSDVARIIQGLAAYFYNLSRTSVISR